MFLYIKTNILRGYGIFKNDFAHPREPANAVVGLSAAKIETSVLFDSKKHSHLYDCYCRQYAGQTQLAFWTIV